MGRGADDEARLRLAPDRLAVLADPADDLLVVLRAARERRQARRPVGVDEGRPERRVAVTERAVRRRGVELAVGEQLVELVPALDLAGVDRLQRAGGPHEQRLVVVAPEHVERVRRRDRDLWLLLRRSEDRLDGEAEILGGLLGDVGSRELDPEREHAQRPRELPVRRCLGRGRARQGAGAGDRGGADGTALEQLAPRQARRLPPLLEVTAPEVFARRKLLGVLEGVVLNLVAHLLSFPPATRRESGTGCRVCRVTRQLGGHMYTTSGRCIQPWAACRQRPSPLAWNGPGTGSAGGMRDADRPSETRRLRPCQEEIHVGDAHGAEVLPLPRDLRLFEHADPPRLEHEPPVDARSQRRRRCQPPHLPELGLDEREHLVDGVRSRWPARRRRAAG